MALCLGSSIVLAVPPPVRDLQFGHASKPEMPPGRGPKFNALWASSDTTEWLDGGVYTTGYDAILKHAAGLPPLKSTSSVANSYFAVVDDPKMAAAEYSIKVDMPDPTPSDKDKVKEVSMMAAVVYTFDENMKWKSAMSYGNPAAETGACAATYQGLTKTLATYNTLLVTSPDQATSTWADVWDKEATQFDDPLAPSTATSPSPTQFTKFTSPTLMEHAESLSGKVKEAETLGLYMGFPKKGEEAGTCPTTAAWTLKACLPLPPSVPEFSYTKDNCIKEIVLLSFTTEGKLLTASSLVHPFQMSPLPKDMNGPGDMPPPAWVDTAKESFETYITMA
jgi:hypothetical protein